jgi:ribosomal protein S18 acetylase RimI-like enzyme
MADEPDTDGGDFDVGRTGPAALSVERGLLADDVTIAVLDRGYSDYVVPIRFAGRWSAMIAAGEVIPALSATASIHGEPVGVALGTRRGNVARLAAVAVVPEHRRSGAGRALCKRVIELARADGAQEIILEVITTNAPAVALYESLGFAPRRRLIGFERAAGAPALDADAFRAALDRGGEPPSWQLELVVERATAATDVTDIPAVVPVAHPLARLLRQAGFSESKLAQSELWLTLGEPV